MKYKYNILKHDKGFALPTVLMVMVVLSILFTTVIMITQANTREIVLQEDNLRAYYIARSGIDIAYTALMEDPSNNGDTKIKKFISDTEATLTHNQLKLPKESSPIGTVDIKVSKTAEEIKIHALAKTLNGPGISSLSLYIDKDNFTKTRWEKK